jgi:hypothetical protein
MTNADYQNSGRLTNGWTDGQTDRWIFDVAERAAGRYRNATMIYRHVSLFLKHGYPGKPKLF